MASRLLWASRAASFLRISVPHRGFVSVPDGLKYSEDHLWVKVDGKMATIGATHLCLPPFDPEYAWVLGLPEVGQYAFRNSFLCGYGTRERVTDVYLYSPIFGEIVDINKMLRISASVMHSSPYVRGWIMKVKMEMTNDPELERLMDAEEYAEYCEEVGTVWEAVPRDEAWS